ncbi:unnamed protein product [Cercopithifilaria johnstoni]|uniref:Uncharacterized protein n=1 Tax=Cercopithifilaria johnstoni TaxID=2874296 RepID=A0A8J2PQ25_9BILA|nr:unnamed protein product [Cercopithifilaria johnstoni]
MSLRMLVALCVRECMSSYHSHLNTFHTQAYIPHRKKGKERERQRAPSSPPSFLLRLTTDCHSEKSSQLKKQR